MADDKPVTKQTVSEFIREVKPDWEHVATVEKQATTQAFSGAPVVRVTGPMSRTAYKEYGAAVPFQDQVDEQTGQRPDGAESLKMWAEKTIEVDDFGQGAKVVGKIGSQVPR
jgi:hypothetical protein